MIDAPSIDGDHDIAIFGGGPAGCGPILHAAQSQNLDRFLDKRVALFDAGSVLGGGEIGQYRIRSDTRADVLLECFQSPGAGAFELIQSGPEASLLREFGTGPAPLSHLAAFLQAQGRSVESWLATSKTSNAFLGHRLDRIVLGENAHVAELAHNGRVTRHRFKRGVLALGGYEDSTYASSTEVLPAKSLGIAGIEHKVVMSSELFRERSERLSNLLRTARRVAIIGASHSALTAAHLLCSELPGLGESSVRIFGRRTPKLFYPSVEEARADGYTDFNEHDVCPTTGRLYRLAGLRFDGRELLRRALGLAIEPEPRVKLVSLVACDHERAWEWICKADVVITALGYRPRIVPIVDRLGEDVVLRANRGGALVDERCRVVRADGEPVPGLLAIGLASSFVPRGALGGEPSFRGQTKGLWLYQNGIGEIVFDQLVD